MSEGLKGFLILGSIVTVIATFIGGTIYSNESKPIETWEYKELDQMRKTCPELQNEVNMALAYDEQVSRWEYNSLKKRYEYYCRKSWTKHLIKVEKE